MSKLKDLQAHGQSIWLDYIRRNFISTGELQALIDDGLRGLTSNPSIFEKAITPGTEYDADLTKLAASNTSAQDIYEQLAIADIQRAADAFRGLYAVSGRRDGFVSIEVSPELSRDTEATLAEARRLWRSVNRENLMIKVPGTPEGLPAIEALISEGINVNVTLLFSVSVYESVAARYMAGLARRAAAGNDIGPTASVASFFVSRVDSAVDKLLDARAQTATEAERSRLRSLRGKAAVANAKLAYERYGAILSTAEWKALASKGAQPQRLLWASTGTKDAAYSDVLYLEELIGRDTVNTVPPKTLEAFIDHGRIRDSLTEDLQSAHSTLQALAASEVSLEDVAQQLLEDGQRLFVEDFRKLLLVVSRAKESSAKAAAPS